LGSGSSDPYPYASAEPVSAPAEVWKIESRLPANAIDSAEAAPPPMKPRRETDMSWDPLLFL
jgi:hypothetical protein